MTHKELLLIAKSEEDRELWIAGFTYAILVAQKIQEIVKNNCEKEKQKAAIKAQELNKQAMKQFRKQKRTESQISVVNNSQNFANQNRISMTEEDENFSKEEVKASFKKSVFDKPPRNESRNYEGDSVFQKQRTVMTV